MFKFLVFLSLISINYIVVGQKYLEYNGSYQMFNSNGFSKFYYTVNHKDTLKNKDFYFEKNESSKDSSNNVSRLVFKGHYSNDLKIKTWSLDYFNLQQNGKPFINTNGFITYPSNGLDYKLRADFYNDEPNGNWLIWSNKINNSIASDTLFTLNAKFKGGNLNGALLVKDTVNQLILNTNDQGLLNGEFWFINTQSGIKEFRLYDKGCLKNHWVEQFNKKNEIYVPLIGDSLKFEIISYDSTYLNYMFYYKLFNKNSNVSHDMIHKNDSVILLYLNKLNYFNGYNLWDEKNNEIKVKHPKIKLQMYDFTIEEEEYLKNISKSFKECELVLNKFLNNPNLDFYEHVSKDIAKVKIILSEYNKIYLNILPLYKFLNSPVIKYFNLSNSLKNILINYNFSNTMKFEFNDSIHSFEYDFKKLKSQYLPNLKSLNSFMLSIQDSIIHIQNSIEPLLRKLESETKLSIKEKELLLLNDSIEVLFSNQNNSTNFNFYHSQFSNNIIGFSKNILRKYANLSVDEKIAYLDNYLNCMYEILNFYTILNKIPTKLERIDELYKRVVFNPYTFTDMEERVKEKVYLYFEQVILPQIILDINQNMSCDNFYEKVENIDKLYRQMVLLREKDTKDLERLIKKNENVNEILKMFNVKVVVN